MAFFRKAGSILRQTVSKQISSDISASKPSIFQIIRCMSSSKVFIGGLSYSTDETSLREAFIKYGDVIEARVIMDRETGRSRGFGFVTYTSSEEASSAIQALDGQDLHGRRVRVNYATDRARGPGFGGGGAYGGGGYGGGGYGGGGSYGGGGYGGGGGEYGSGGGNYGGGGYGSNYGTGGGGSYGGSGGGGYGSGAGGGFGVAGGTGGSDNYPSGDAAGGLASTGGGGDIGSGSGFPSTGLGYGGGDQFASNEAGTPADTDDPLEENDKDDDDEPDDFANDRRG